MALVVLHTLCFIDPHPVSAQLPVHVHVVREGETLATIAQSYYGETRREMVLAMENGLPAPPEALVVTGQRLIIPRAVFHQVRRSENWLALSIRYYGTGERSAVLYEANRQYGDSTAPREGAEIVVPYPLRYTARDRASLSSVATEFLGRESEVRVLRRFNGLRSSVSRLDRGQTILVPMAELTFSDPGRELASSLSSCVDRGGAIRQLQERIEAQLPELAQHLAEGRYMEAVALGNQMLGTTDLSGNQTVSIERSLGVAYVALGRADLATRAFRNALSFQPDLELDSRRTSPAVLEAFRQAQRPEATE